jgi:hypothetical protein
LVRKGILTMAKIVVKEIKRRTAQKPKPKRNNPVRKGRKA